MRGPLVRGIESDRRLRVGLDEGRLQGDVRVRALSQRESRAEHSDGAPEHALVNMNVP